MAENVIDRFLENAEKNDLPLIFDKYMSSGNGKIDFVVCSLFELRNLHLDGFFQSDILDKIRTQALGQVPQVIKRFGKQLSRIFNFLSADLFLIQVNGVKVQLCQGDELANVIMDLL